MEKYKLTDEDVAERIVQQYKYFVRPEWQQVFYNLVDFIGNGEIKTWTSQRHIVVSLTELELIELNSQWPEYRKAIESEVKKLAQRHRKERAALPIVFIHTHKLYAAKNEARDINDLTPEEREIIEAAMRMDVNRISVHKKLMR